MKNIPNTSLWQKIQTFNFDCSASRLTFSDRLARENRWSSAYTQRVINEYRKFLYLCAAAGHPVTPSDEVDQAWHLHLCYTQSYWQDLCRDTLGFELHHGPTQGGKKERAKYRDWYARTLNRYEEIFQCPPPSDIWPDADKRFSTDYQRIDRKQYFVIPKWPQRLRPGRLRPGRLRPNAGILAALALLAISVLTSCTSDSSDNSSWICMAIFGLFLLNCLIIILKGVKGDGGGGSSGCSGWFGDSGCSSDSDCGGCGGGCGGG